MKHIKTLLILLSLFSFYTLHADISDDEKIKILTEYLVQKEGKQLIQARNEAIATIYGKPLFEDLIYNDTSEMFFGSIVSERGSFKKDINFYMPQTRAIEFQKNLAAGKIEIEHAFDDNDIVIKSIEVEFKGVYYPLKVNDTNTITFRIGNYFLAHQNTEVMAEKNGIGATINLQEIFDMTEQTDVFRFDAHYKFSPNHALEFSYYTINNNRTKAIGEPIEWNGYYIKDGTLSVKFDTDIYKLNYVYSAYRTNKIDLSLRVGLHITGLTTGITGKADTDKGEVYLGEQSTVQLTAPLPVIGIGLKYEIIPRLYVNYTVDYFFLSFEDVQGSLVDSLLSVEYQYNRYFGAGLGFNATNSHLKTTVEDVNYELQNEVSGFLAYIILSY